MSDLSKAVRKALQRSPASERALARSAGVPASTLSRIRTGEREATEDVARRLAAAFEGWARECQEAQEEILREATGRKL